MALKQIKSKIKSTDRTSKVTKAMEAVSAVKMRKSQERALDGRPYAETALRILERVSHTSDARRHPLFAEREHGKFCVIVITSDKGLAGSLNSAVIKEAAHIVGVYPKEKVELVCFGKKGYEYFLRRGYQIALHYLNVRDDVALDDMEEVVSFVATRFESGEYRRVRIVYQSFISTFEQAAVVRQVLPIKDSAVKEIVDEIVPKRGRFSEREAETAIPAYTVEPTLSAVYRVIFPLLIKIMLYHTLLESKASEHSSRMVAMKNATDKAKEVSKVLTLAYNKARQGAITREVSEITGGIEAMKN
jgi:F-type H+-transporting ATPase subunit gamma